MSCTLPNSGAASHRHATHRYPGKLLMCCAEHAEPGMVSQGPAIWPHQFGRTTQSVSHSLPAESKDMAHTSVHALPEQHNVALALTLAVCVVAHEKCAAPGSTHAACIRLPGKLGRTHKLVILY